MYKLVKPRKQSYKGEDTRVLAYSDICELAWIMSVCSGSIGAAAMLGLAVPPALIAFGVSCFVYHVIFSAKCHGYF